MKHEQHEPLTEVELLDLGRHVETDPTLYQFERQGRLITNLEMYAVGAFLRDQRRKAERFLLEEL